MTALTTVPSMPKLAGLKEIVDPDLLLGLGLSVALDFALGYVAIKLYPPLTGRPFGFMNGKGIDVFGYDDIILFAIYIAGMLLTKGRLRKIMIYAFWFWLFLKIAAIVMVNSGIGFM
jgi:hypothetical protein